MERTQLERELESHHAAAFGWALHLCGDRATAEDVLQTSYLKIADGRARFAERSSFRTWLFGVIRRTASESRRREAIRRFVSLGHLDGRAEEHGGGEDIARKVDRSEESAQLLQALGTLPKRQREVLHLVFYQDLTIKDAATVMNVSLGTARTHYERGKKRLRELLDAELMIDR